MGDWLPRSVVCLKTYTRRMFVGDLLAGVTVGLVALPLAMAFAIASGVPPQTGLYCAIVAGFTISALGGSTTQIGGPNRCLRCCCFRNCGKARRRRIVRVYVDRRNSSADPGRNRIVHSGKVHTTPGGGQFYEWNCSHYCQHANQGLLWFQNRRGPGRIFVTHSDARAFFAIPARNTTRHFCARDDYSFHALREEASGIHCGAVPRNCRRGPLETARSDDRYSFQGYPVRASGAPDTALSPGPNPPASFTGDYRRYVGSDRILDVGRCVRPHEWWKAQPEGRAHRSRCREHSLSAVRRTAGHRSDRRHRHQYPFRSRDAGSGMGSTGSKCDIAVGLSIINIRSCKCSEWRSNICQNRN